MVNFIGRLFVMLTFCGSMLFLALAIGVYANHVNWKSAKKDDPGVVDKLMTKIGEVAYSRDKAVARYNAAFAELGNAEATRRQRLYFYDVKYKMLQTGKDEKGVLQPTPVYRLETDQSGSVVIRMVPADPTFVIQERGEPLLSQQAYLSALAARAKEIADEQTKVETLQTELANLTDVMEGKPNQPGLIRQKEIMVVAKVKAMSEQEFLKPFLANRFAEATMALEREQDLKRRLGQLDGRPAGRAEGN